MCKEDTVYAFQQARRKTKCAPFDSHLLLCSRFLKDSLFLILKKLEDCPRTQLPRRKAACPLNSPSERTRRFEAKLEGQFLNSSPWVRFQKTFDPSTNNSSRSSRNVFPLIIFMAFSSVRLLP